MKLVGVVAVFVLSILSLNLVYATVTCNPISFSKSYTQGDSVSSNTICSNDGNSSVSISKSGDYFTIDQSVISQSPATKTITINYDSNAPVGLHSGLINFGDGSTSIPIFFNVNQQQQQDGCNIDIFPTVLTNIKIQQGETKTRNIQLSVPSCYKSPITINGVALQTDEKPIQLGELSIGTIQPGNSVMIPIDINAVGISTGQYSDTLQFLLYNQTGAKINVPSVSISVLATTGIQPITNFSLANLPTCSLNAIEMSLNSTYKLTCTVTPNIEIKPLIDSKFIKGLSVSETSSQYIYEFQPIIIGETIIGVEFLYKNAPLGSPFLQDIRITPSGGSPVQGTTLKAIFYQGGASKSVENLVSGTTNILIVDNKTNSVVPNFNLLLNGILKNSTIELEADKPYELRVSSSGYLDLVLNLTVSEAEIKITLTPEKSEYNVGDIVNITTTPNSSLLLDNVVITSPYTFNLGGEFSLLAVKEGYIDTQKNITVLGSVSYKAVTPVFDDWKKGSNVKMELTKNVSWSVEFEKSYKEEGNTLYNPSMIVASGEGDMVEFKIEDYGRYSIKTGDEVIVIRSVEASKWFWNILVGVGYWWIFIGLVLILAGYFLFFRGKTKTSESPLVFSAQSQE